MKKESRSATIPSPESRFRQMAGHGEFGRKKEEAIAALLSQRKGEGNDYFANPQTGEHKIPALLGPG
jgi:hypothetical protein